MQSLGIIVSPLAAPSDTLDAPWAMGSTGFCSATGFILNIGGLLIPFYTLFLTYYFLQRIKYKVTPAQFARKMELRITTFIWLFPVVGGLVGLVNGYFNPGPKGSLCMMVAKPLQCNIDPKTYGDCARGEKAPLASLFLVILPLVFSFAIIIINLARFTLHVYQQERMFKPTNQEPTNGSDGKGCINGTSSAADVDSSIRDEGSRRVPGSLAKQSLVQSSLYIASFIICYVPVIISILMAALRIMPPAWLYWLNSIFWPLGGFFNILIYTRPKVSCYKDSNPEYSRLYVFLIIVLSGGEVPTEIDFGDDQNNDFISERERVLNSIPLKIYDLRRCGKDFRRALHAKKATEDSPPALQVSTLDSMPMARVKSHDSCYKEVLEMNSFEENSHISRNDKEHSYGTKVAFSVPSVIGRQDYEDVSSWTENP
jgi:hypothetical protein